MVDDAGQHVGSGRVGLGSAEAGAHSTVVLTQESLATVEAPSSHSESQRRTVFDWTGSWSDSTFPPLTRLSGQKAQPGDKGGNVGKGGEVGTDFCQQHLCGQRVNARHLSEIDPESAVEILPEADRFVSPRDFGGLRALGMGSLAGSTWAGSSDNRCLTFSSTSAISCW